MQCQYIPDYLPFTAPGGPAAVHRRVAHFLERKGKASKYDLGEAYLAALSEDVRAAVEERMYLRDPDHDLEDPYEVDFIRECVEFVILGRSQFSRLRTPYQKKATRIEAVKPYASVKEPKVEFDETNLLRWQIEKLRGQIETCLSQQQTYPSQEGPLEIFPLERYPAGKPEGLGPWCTGSGYRADTVPAESEAQRA